MAFLKIVNATKSYGTVEVLHDINLSVEQGDLIVLVGPSGCGKSTLLNMIAGLEEVTSGEIFIRERLVNGVHPSRRNIAMVFQSYALYPNMTVAQNITFGLEMHGVPKPERNRALAEVAKLLQIEQLLKRRPSQLSGGQRQRVAMGRALVRKPDVFLFDEPLSNLDAKLRVDMRTEIKKLHQDLGATMIYVTHDQIEAMTLSTRIAVMHQGYLQQVGTPREIYDSPANLFVAGFMGSPSMNLLDARLVEAGGETASGGHGCERRSLETQAVAALCSPGTHWTGCHPRRPPRGHHRPRRRRPKCREHTAHRKPGQRYRARRFRYVRDIGDIRERLYGPNAGRRAGSPGRGLRLRFQHGQGGDL